LNIERWLLGARSQTVAIQQSISTGAGLRTRSGPPTRSGLSSRDREGAVSTVCALIFSLLFVASAFSQTVPGPDKITLDQAIELALERNHGLLAARTSILQNQAQEITANLRPNPTLFIDWEYLPLYHPEGGIANYLHDSTEGDVGMSYLFERGQKRQHRLQAAKDATAVTRSAITDNERTLVFQVAQLYVGVQLAQSTLDLARQDLKSFQTTVDISEHQFKVGAISENDYLKMKLQLVQFQTDLEQAEVTKAQSLASLRQLLGFESVASEYDVAEALEYRPAVVKLEELQTRALENRPDLRAAVLGTTAAKSQYELAKANGKQDVTGSTNYSHVNALSAVTFSVSMPLPVFDRNQGNIAQARAAITQAQEQQKSAGGQVLTDVKVAYEGLLSSDRIVQIYLSGARDSAKRSRDISEYAYRRGSIPMLDFLDAERNYRATELAYRQALAAYVTAIEQLRQAVGTRSMP
jgi:outer membrane protein, heavy metal efflux system